MKFLFDLFPVILFFVMFKWGGSHPEVAQACLNHYFSSVISGGAVTLKHAPIMLATLVAIIATFGQIGYLYARGKKIDGTLWFSLVIILIFGGATIYFQNETFILWKPTVLYWSFSVALLLAQFLFKKNLVRTMLGAQISPPETIWQQLNFAWAIFFGVLGVLNLYVAFNFSLDAWVNFKLFGFTGIIFAFFIVQIFFLYKYIKETP